MVTVPPWRALLAFRAVGVHGRLADAARALNVTESAISHQLRQLEDGLHANLFDRSRGRLTLTDAGRRYFESVDRALAEIEAATAALQPASGRQTVRLTLPPSLAVTWMIPRLGAFEASHPAIDLHLVSTTRLVDLAREQVDLAIRYGRGPWPKHQSRRLFHDLGSPVVAPGVLPPDVAWGELPATVRLVRNNSTPAEWDEWARARGLDPPDLTNAIALDSIDQALRVAEAGAGMAMGRTPYIDEALAEGRLVAPFGAPGPTGAAYHLVFVSSDRLTAAARHVARFIEAEAAAMASALPPDAT